MLTIIIMVQEGNTLSVYLIGVSVSEEWRNSFESFITDMGSRPTATSTIERIDGSLGYCKDNCCWIEKSLQSGNRRKPCKKGTSEIKREGYLKRKIEG